VPKSEIDISRAPRAVLAAQSLVVAAGGEVTVLVASAVDVTDAARRVLRLEREEE
jgi:hypothetical protein